MSFFKKYILILVLIAAFFLRFQDLDKNPPSLTWDEVAWGYNAYSLGIDFKDEFGKFLPISYLESFGDFKPPLYAYLSIIPIRLFGLNGFSVRFISAFFGVLTVLITYLLIKKIFENKDIALLSSFLLAISPWHIMLSRAAFEANLASFFIVFGVYLFLAGMERKGYLFFSLTSFVLSMYTFNTSRIVSPLLVLGLFFFYRKNLINRKTETTISAFLAFLLFIPLAMFLLTPQAQLRFTEVNIFSDPNVVERANREIENDKNSLWSKMIHNRRFAYGVEFLHHYFDNLNPQFLFIKGDGNPKFSIQDVGEMYIWEIPFFVSGVLFLFRRREGKWLIIPYWLVIGLIPAGTARETPHALRIEAALPTFQVLSAYGIYQLTKLLNNINLGTFQIKKVFIFLVSSVILINFTYFYHNLMDHYPNEFAGEWQFGYKEVIDYVNNVEKKYDRVYITTELGRPYIYVLFYKKYDPSMFRSEVRVEREAAGFVHIESFGKYVFFDKGKLVLDRKGMGKILVIDSPSRVPNGSEKVKSFFLPNGQEILSAYIR